MYIISLGVIGRKAEAAEYARKWAAREKIKPVDAVRFRFYEAILSGKSTDGLMDQSLSRKDQAAVYLSAARQTLTWNMSDLSEKYTKEYKKFFVPFEPRRFVVNYSDTPISGIAAWRKIYPELEKQYCDIPYRGSMEFLETDVSTGNRSVNTEVKTDTVSKNMEMTAVCDRYGLHVFLRCEDENARDIERGFAPGIATEIYFAPGRNQPYICIGGGVATVDFLWQSSYNHKNHTRLIQNQAKPTFRHEAEFTDKDYVLHLFFAWDSYYNKLPENGRNWRFECLAWAPSGGFSWGGSQGIHSASSWGDLEFKLNKKQIAEIKRELIAKTYRNYKQVPKSPGITENLFQCWADDAIGDPVFYDKYLKDLEKELDSY